MNHAPQQRAEPPRPSLATALCPTRTLRQLAFGLLLLGSPAALEAQSVAFTLDDGPRLEATPMLSPEQRNTAMLRHLHQHQVQALFFVTTGNGADRPEGLALLKALSAGGQLLGNHTVSHPDFNAAGTTLQAFEAEVLGCDQVIATLPGYRKLLRFPYLREGASVEKRDGIRAFLKSKDYRIGYVSIDTSDWIIDEKLRKKLEADPKADLTPWRAFYLAHLWERAQTYERLARGTYGREIPHTLLLHHNLLNALFLGDVIAMFQAKGWRIVSPDVAFADPAYAVAPLLQRLDGSVLETTAQALGIPLGPFFKGITSERKVGEMAGAL